MLVVLVIVLVVLLLLVALRWAERRDRGKGHVNRRSRDLRSALQDGKEKKLKTQLRQPRGPLGY